MNRKKNAMPTNSFVSWLLYFACMKNRMTSVALVMAMPIATGKLNAPRLTNATATVTRGQHHQRAEDRVVDALGRDVSRHGVYPT